MSDSTKKFKINSSSFIGENSSFCENFSALSSRENDDMTNSNSDSGFTELNQTGSSDTSRSAKSKTASPVPDSQVRDGESSSSLNRSDDQSSDEDDSDDDDYDESDGSRPSVISWVRQQVQKGADPRDIIKLLLPNFNVPENMTEVMLWRIITIAVAPQRERLTNVKTIQDAVQLIRNAKNIIVLTGAGVSVSCGIPDFRSRDGVYSRLSREYPNLPDPQAMFDIKYFYQDPRPFFKFAREIFPGQFKPSPSHRFIKKLEERNLLLRNYTQNIDTLERVAGISKLIECHGSFATASCTRCKFRINGDAIREDILQMRIPICFMCNPNRPAQNLSTAILDSESLDSDHLRNLAETGIFKPDIVFFGEELPDDFHDNIDTDRNKCDLLIVIGSSLKVKPVAMIPNLVQEKVPQILINREPLPHMNFDVNLFGDSDVIIHHLCSLLDDEQCQLTETTIELPTKASSPATEADKVSEVENTEVAESSTSKEIKAEASSSSSKLEEVSNSAHVNSLVHHLPPDTFAQIAPRCYVFPGAEVTMESLEADSEESDDDFSEEDEDCENELSSANEIVVPDIDNVLSVGTVAVPEVSPTLPSSLSPTPSSVSQLQCNDQEAVENINDIEAVEATEDLEQTPMKRPRMELDAGKINFNTIQ